MFVYTVSVSCLGLRVNVYKFCVNVSTLIIIMWPIVANKYIVIICVCLVNVWVFFDVLHNVAAYYIILCIRYVCVLCVSNNNIIFTFCICTYAYYIHIIHYIHYIG